MERSSKLADLKLVSKYYPVANYSYPQPERRSQNGRSRTLSNRTSLGSEGSVPGLIDDRTDSEVSVDDDYQYHAHASELWDTFWKPGSPQEKEENPDAPPRKQYPALIPSPQSRMRGTLDGRRINAWPLPDSSKNRSRKPGATYSPFPKLVPLPPRTTSLTPSWQCSREKQRPQRPQRPPRPDDDVVKRAHDEIAKHKLELAKKAQDFTETETPCAGAAEKVLEEVIKHPPVEVITEPPPREEVLIGPLNEIIRYTEIEFSQPPPRISPIVAQFAASPNPHKTNFPRPDTPKGEDQHKHSLDSSLPTPPDSPTSIYSMSSQSATHLPLLDPKPIHAMPPKKSVPCLRTVRGSELGPQLHSVFEYDDSDDESEGESGALSFFRFHRRGSSDSRRSSKDSGLRRWRTNTNTAPSSPNRDAPERLSKSDVSGRKRPGADVLGRMLGLRLK